MVNYLISKIQDRTIGWSINSQSTPLNNQAFAIAALANAGLVDSKVQVGLASGYDFTYMLDKFVDYIQDIQCPLNGGWGRFKGDTPNGYNTGGFIYALSRIEYCYPFSGKPIPAKMINIKDRLANSLVNFISQDGGAGYLMQNIKGSVEITGLFLAGCSWLKWNQWGSWDSTNAGYISIPGLTRGQAAKIYNQYYNYIYNNWCLSNTNATDFTNPISFWSDGNYNSNSTTNSMVYSMLNTKIAAIESVPNIDKFNGFNNIGEPHDWAREFSIDLVKSQNSNGSFPKTSSYWIHTIFDIGEIGQTVLSALELNDRFYFGYFQNPESYPSGFYP